MREKGKRKKEVERHVVVKAGVATIKYREWGRQWDHPSARQPLVDRVFAAQFSNFEQVPIEYASHTFLYIPRHECTLLDS